MALKNAELWYYDRKFQDSYKRCWVSFNRPYVINPICDGVENIYIYYQIGHIEIGKVKNLGCLEAIWGSYGVEYPPVQWWGV